MKIGYLMNSYPMTSTTFIRSEIEALESLDVEIQRYAVRRWDQTLVDPLDIAETTRTEYLLSENPGKLFYFLIVEIFSNFSGFARAIGPWCSQVRRSEGNLVKHIAYLLEAILLRRLTKRDGVDAFACPLLDEFDSRCDASQASRRPNLQFHGSWPR